MTAQVFDTAHNTFVASVPWAAIGVVAPGEVLPSYEILPGQGGPHRTGWVAEPWVGHLAKAPLLFVSSNPAGGGVRSSDPEALSADSSDEGLLAGEDSAFDEGQHRDELFARGIFDSILEARIPYEDWRHAYNLHRPYRALGLQPPAVFAAAFNNPKRSPAQDS